MGELQKRQSHSQKVDAAYTMVKVGSVAGVATIGTGALAYVGVVTLLIPIICLLVTIACIVRFTSMTSK